MFLWVVILVLFSEHGFTTSAPEQSFDTVFLVDSSNNVRDGEKFNLIRRFVVNLTRELIATGNHRVGIVSFSGLVYRVALPLTDDRSQVDEGVLPRQFDGGYTYIDKALNFTFDQMFNGTARIGDGKQIVTVLGGKLQDYDAITKMANSLKAKGLEMYSVGVGDDFFETTKDLRTLASTPVKEHTLRTKYNSLLKSSSIMMKKLKEVVYAGLLEKKKKRKKKKNSGTNDQHHNLHRKTIKSTKHHQVYRNTKIREKTMVRVNDDTKNHQTKQAIASTPKNEKRKAKNRIIAATKDNEGDMARDKIHKIHNVTHRRTMGEVAQKRPELIDAATIATPPLAHPDLGNLINDSSPPSGYSSCVGHVPDANRVLTDGGMVTGIIANTTVIHENNENRECGPGGVSPIPDTGIKMGDSGVDSTWDYGK